MQELILTTVSELKKHWQDSPFGEDFLNIDTCDRRNLIRRVQ
ncbi:hypothetical protein [Pleurocapsa sp. PCC 7319]|nr:hypothetical protein [Pleurocapsa sp. PCC 7319]